MARRRSISPRWNSLVAAAEVMTAPNMSLRLSIGKQHGWQHEAWEFYDTVGELRFAATWVANALSRVNLIAASAPLSPGDEPTPIDPAQEATAVQRRAAELVAMIAGGPSTQGQIMASFGVNLTVAGLCWLVIEPDEADPMSDRLTHWMVYSTDEVRSAQGEIEIRVSDANWRPIHPNAVVIKCWRRHPRRSWDADAPTHAVLSILREITLLQAHINASAQSRLAGAGILALPSEAVFPPGQGPQTSTSVDPDDENLTAPEDTFIDTLVEAMTVPIVDRGSAAAVVPLVVKVPGEYVDKIKHISFATPFDDRVMELLENAIKRLSLGMDIPPEVLTGKGPSNHWSAWQVQEESITLHVEPLSEVVVNAFTIGFLKPALLAEGFTSDEADSVMVWYDTTDLRTRPDRSGNAIQAYDRNELSSAGLLRELGLSVEDAPTEAEKREKILLSVARGAPTLAPTMLAELGLLNPADLVAPPQAAPVDGAPVEPATPAQPNALPEQPTEAPVPSEAIVAACHVLVTRAMEKAGARLRSAAGKRTPGGAAAITCTDPAMLHTTLDATAHADLATLLAGAWTHVPEVAQACNMDADDLTRYLDDYARTLLATGTAHDITRLADCLATRRPV